MGPEPNDTKDMRILNRLLTWHEWGISYEADPRLVGKVLEELGLRHAKGVSTPGRRKEQSLRMKWSMQG